jgi:hypothetical protein
VRKSIVYTSSVICFAYIYDCTQNIALTYPDTSLLVNLSLAGIAGFVDETASVHMVARICQLCRMRFFTSLQARMLDVDF